MQASFKDILEAFEFASMAGGANETQVYLCKHTGKIYRSGTARALLLVANRVPAPRNRRAAATETSHKFVQTRIEP